MVIRALTPIYRTKQILTLSINGEYNTVKLSNLFRFLLIITFLIANFAAVYKINRLTCH